mmetsp:Transcript_62238/g.167014  ORF Transcript_62238/g.167014 Transcript_62238/m.167014 type:complete len:193 (+) Transcript_62238:593-1171(+)
MRRPRTGLGLGVVRGRIYVLGGQSGLEPLSTVESLDPREGAWRKEPEMLYHRAYPGSTWAGDCIFVAGGCFGQTMLSTCEMFDARRSRWVTLPSMSIARNGVALSVAPELDLLVAAGGFDGRANCLRVVESLDMSKSLAKGEWGVMPEMLRVRDGPCLEFVEGAVAPATALKAVKRRKVEGPQPRSPSPEPD